MQISRVKWGLLTLLPLLWAQPGWTQGACVRTGYIQVTNADTGANLGFVSNVFNQFGEYGVTTDVNNRLTVSFSGTSQFSLTATNGPNSNLPYVGGIVGFSNTSDDLNTGSYNYTYLGGTVQTPANSPPVSGDNSFTEATGVQERIESAIWSISPSNVLTAQWVNTDLSKPATYEMLYTAQNNLTLTGDKAVFVNTFGSSVPVTFTFVGTACPQDQIKALIALVQSFHLPKGTETSLNAKLQAALTAVNAGQTASACSAISDFINEVHAQSGKKLTVDQANQLLNAAAAIQPSLGCAASSTMETVRTGVSLNPPR
jgi:hypothetical protein